MLSQIHTFINKFPSTEFPLNFDKNSYLIAFEKERGSQPV